jgi:SAM-dependent methyltransferase
MSLTSSPAAPQRISRCAIDEPTGPGPFTFSAGDDRVIAGWAFLEPPTSTIPLVALDVLSLKTCAVMRLSAERSLRPDVASHFGDDRLKMSGFTSRLRICDRFRGDHSVRLVQIDDSDVYPPVDLFSFTVPPAAYERCVRRDLAARFLRGSGVEIGALQRRLDVPDHCSVTYVDRMPLADLLVHYAELRDQPLQKPDLIDDGETLGKVGTGTLDFVIANHFLEHCENPIQTIVNFARVLKDDGILYMAVPDKRYTFDLDRSATPYTILSETFRLGRRCNREELYVEWATCVARAPRSEVSTLACKLMTENYSIHFNVWALRDLLEFVFRSQAEFTLPLTLECVVCSENEVILVLKKRSSANELNA